MSKFFSFNCDYSGIHIHYGHNINIHKWKIGTSDHVEAINNGTVFG